MKKILFSFLIISFAIIVKAGSPNDIVGTWLVGDKDYKIELYKKGDILEGKVVWLKIPNDEKGKPRTDVDNPDEKLKSRPVLGLVTLTGFKWSETEKMWIDGKVYKKGKIYCGKAKLDTDGTFKLTGYICNMKFLKKNDTWTRVK